MLKLSLTATGWAAVMLSVTVPALADFPPALSLSLYVKLSLAVTPAFTSKAPLGS